MVIVGAMLVGRHRGEAYAALRHLRHLNDPRAVALLDVAALAFLQDIAVAQPPETAADLHRARYLEPLLGGLLLEAQVGEGRYVGQLQ
eukprot:9373316-Pyramimonas_sp.AAC.1